MKREIPLVISFIAGLVMMIQFYSPRVDYAGGFFGSRGVGDTFLSWFNIVTVFAYILGVGSMLAVNGGKIIKNQPGWGYNVLLIVSFAVTLYLGVMRGTGQGTGFYWIFEYVYGPLQATMYALLAFFIASAAFRAFKAKTVEATFMLVTAFIVMLGRVPVGEQLWNGFWAMLHLDGVVMSINTLIDRWIMGSFNTAGQRAILLGASVGAISVSLKILLGIERSYLGGD
jgi:hypothetical protein